MKGEYTEEKPMAENQEDVAVDQKSLWKDEEKLEAVFDEFCMTQYMAEDMDLEEILEVLGRKTVRFMKKTRSLLNRYWETKLILETEADFWTICQPFFSPYQRQHSRSDKIPR